MKRYIDKLDESKDRLIQVAFDCTDKTNEKIDYNLFLWSILNRAMSINRGFLCLTKEDNYLCAIPLMRMQVDNCIRLYGIHCVADPHAFIMSWMNGNKISTLKDKNNHKLTDRLLVENLEEKYHNIVGIYDSACNFVHLSQENLYNTAQAIDGTREITCNITGYDRIPDNVKDNIDKCMVYVNNILIDIIYDYAREINVIEKH
jgi:hypothetical protein